MAYLWLIILALSCTSFIVFKDKIFLILFLSSFATILSINLVTNIYVPTLTFIISFLGLYYFLIHIKKQSLFNLNLPNLEDLIGFEAQVVEKIEVDSTNYGTIKLNGDFWYAKNTSNTPFQKGDTVRVVCIKGLFAYVKPI
ncbi:MAG: hypothetical protein ATN36_00155 [Epulopiscium sp. Nele67-Bin005]|nr:MAG: hypothetical protein ATN36_00155 [Epulopiscium sp. Nele67-Bin005]